LRSSCSALSVAPDEANLHLRSTWLDAGVVRSGGAASTMGTCVAGELVAVDVEVSNPLQVCTRLWIGAAESWCSSPNVLQAVTQPNPMPGCRFLHLQIELNLSQLRVVCELRPAGGGPEPTDTAGEGLSGSGTAEAPVVVALEQTLRLRGGERSWVGGGVLAQV
jgi:hypothetical protein